MENCDQNCQLVIYMLGTRAPSSLGNPNALKIGSKPPSLSLSLFILHEHTLIPHDVPYMTAHDVLDLTSHFVHWLCQKMWLVLSACFWNHSYSYSHIWYSNFLPVCLNFFCLFVWIFFCNKHLFPDYVVNLISCTHQPSNVIHGLQCILLWELDESSFAISIFCLWSHVVIHNGSTSTVELQANNYIILTKLLIYRAL